MGASTGPEAIRDRIEIRLEYGLQHHFERHLDQSILKRGDAQGPELSRFARFRDQPLPNRLGPVGSMPQVLPDILQKACDTIGAPFDRLPRHAIRARCIAAPVTSQPFPSVDERSAVADNIEQIRKHHRGVRGTPPIQLALHVENEPGIHRVGQEVHLLLAQCIHCLPSPCGRLSRPRTTTQAPSPRRMIAGRFGHPSPKGSGNAAGSQVPPLLLVRFRSRLYPV